MTRTIIAGLAAGVFLLCSAPVPAQTAAEAPVQTTLSNGLHVVLLPSRLAPVATTVVTYNVGSSDDTLPGVAHATEHMLFRGTKELSAAQFAIVAARTGADYNAETTDTYTDYYFKVPSAYASLALKLEADRMTGALMEESAWKTERPAIEQEVRAHESVPGAGIDAKVRKALFGDSPYARDGVGTIESFNKMTAHDIAAFYHTWYHPNNATIVVSGDIDTAKVLDEIHKDFDGIPSANVPAHPVAQLKPLDAGAIRDTIAELPLPIAAYAYRFPTLESPDYAAGQVLEMAMDNGRGAFADLQSQGKILAGFASAGAYRDIGTMEVAAIGLPGQTPDAVNATLNGVVDTYRTNGIPQALFDAAKLRMISQQDYRQESISGLAFTWAQWTAMTGHSPDDFYASLQNVSLNDVNRVLRTYVDPQHSLDLLVTPKNVTSMPHVDPNAGVENVAFTPDREVALPAWTNDYFNTPLKVPQSDKQVVTYHLKNGLTLTVRPEHFAPTVALGGRIRESADLYEPRGKDGVSQIADTLLGWGTTTYGRSAYQAQADAIAATLRLGPSFSASSQAKNFDRAVQLLADGLLHPAYPDAAFATVKSNTERTLGAMESLPRTQVEIEQAKALYPPGDPRRRRATAQTVANITLKDVRHWHEFAYRPDETTIAIVGDVTPAGARAIIEKYFGAWKNPGRQPSFTYPEIRRGHQTSVTVTSPSSTHSEVTLSQVISVRRGNPDAIALSLADTMLSGEGTASILFRDLRTDRGYVYDASSDVSIGRSNSTFSIDFATDPKNVSKAQAAAIADIRRLQQMPVAVADLQRAKALLLAQRVLPLDSYDGIAGDILVNAETGFTAQDDDLYWRLLLSITPQQVQSAMRRYVKPNGFSRVILAPGA